MKVDTVCTLYYIWSTTWILMFLEALINADYHFEQTSTKVSTRTMTINQKLDSSDKWQEYQEEIISFDMTSFRANTLLDHMNITKDASDYVWYTFR